MPSSLSSLPISPPYFPIPFTPILKPCPNPHNPTQKPPHAPLCLHPPQHLPCPPPAPQPLLPMRTGTIWRSASADPAYWPHRRVTWPTAPWLRPTHPYGAGGVARLVLGTRQIVTRRRC